MRLSTFAYPAGLMAKPACSSIITSGDISTFSVTKFCRFTIPLRPTALMSIIRSVISSEAFESTGPFGSLSPAARTMGMPVREYSSFHPFCGALNENFCHVQRRNGAKATAETRAATKQKYRSHVTHSRRLLIESNYLPVQIRMLHPANKE